MKFATPVNKICKNINIYLERFEDKVFWPLPSELKN